MIHSIIQPISEIITALPYVGKYGAVVSPKSRYVQVRTDENDNPIVREEKFPIACGVTVEQCWEQGRYKDLIPDDSYKSIFYFEQTDGVRFDGIDDKVAGHTFYKFSERLRLVGWLNLAKLGLSDCSGSTGIEFDLFKRLNLNLKDITDPMNIWRLEIRTVGVEPKSSNPFTKYGYADLEGFDMYPYDYLSMMVELKFWLHINCIPAFEPGASIDCPIWVEPDPQSPGQGMGKIPFNYLNEEQLYSLATYFGNRMYSYTWLMGDGTDTERDLGGLVIANIDEIVNITHRSKIAANGNRVVRKGELVPNGSGGYKFMTFIGETNNSVTVEWTK